MYKNQELSLIQFYTLVYRIFAELEKSNTVDVKMKSKYNAKSFYNLNSL